MPRNWENGKYRWVVKQLSKQLKDGQAFEAVRFADFNCEPHSFMSQLYALARSRDLRVSCASTSTRVIYRFYAPNSSWKPNLAAFAVVKRARLEEDRAS